MAALDQSPLIICSIVQEEIGNQSCRPARRELTCRRSVIGFGCVLPIARLALVGCERARRIKVGSKTISQTAIAIPTAVVDHGTEIATATASQSASRARNVRSK
jgi:hypothetical protein